jgi:hypothetical protein
MTVDPMFAPRLAGPPGVRGAPGLLAANADRDRALDVLKAGFAEGRLTKAEYDDRAGRVYASRTYGDLAPLIADLPAGPLSGPGPLPGAPYLTRPRVNATAAAALTCGIAVFLTMGLTGVPAIVLGHRARREVRRTGERGDSIALTGVALGWAGVALIAAFVVALMAISVGHAGHAVIAHPGPGGPGGPILGGPNPGGPFNGG